MEVSRVGVLAILFGVPACSAPATPPPADLPASWVSLTPGSPASVSWVRNGPDLTGEVDMMVSVDGLPSRRSTGFRGVLDPGLARIVLALDTALPGGERSLAGSVTGTELVLALPGRGEVSLRPGTDAEYEQVVREVATALDVQPSRRFDATEVAEGVRRILTDPAPEGDALDGIRDVHCPADRPVTVSLGSTARR
ncbi:hypothetical protein J2S58_000805 [Nakamurella flavida]|nr:hypothetical protein [Nakamurella flavida]MDP9777182.1 hypothetical protein [Nakamurella flavida]